jgi:hypothetical protein
MLEHPKNPLQSPFAPSYLATYQCASNFVKAATNHFETLPELCRRIWNIWTSSEYFYGKYRNADIFHWPRTAFSAAVCHLLLFIFVSYFFQVIIGAIIIRSPASSIAPRAFVELGLACDLFEKGVQKGLLQSEKGRAALVRTCLNSSCPFYDSNFRIY